MNDTLQNKHPYYNDTRLNVRTIISVCIGIFLFLLFFQPFVLSNSDFNNKLMTLAAFGGITGILFVIMRLQIPVLFPRAFQKNKWNANKELLYDFIFVALNSVAYSFFARYVGKIPVTFQVVTIIVIISITSIIIIVVANEIHYLKKQVKLLSVKPVKLEDEKPVEENVKIDFESENKSEYFQLLLNQIIVIKSANNYIEVIYKDENKISKKLIRNTLKNTEILFEKHTNIVRCHRSCMVNKNYIQKATKGSDGLILTITDYPQAIHVSRQYVLKVKEALKAK